MSSDNYRDGCSKRAGLIPFLVITAVQVGAWLSTRLPRGRR